MTIKVDLSGNVQYLSVLRLWRDNNFELFSAFVMCFCVAVCVRYEQTSDFQASYDNHPILSFILDLLYLKLCYLCKWLVIIIIYFLPIFQKKEIINSVFFYIFVTPRTQSFINRFKKLSACKGWNGENPIWFNK